MTTWVEPGGFPVGPCFGRIGRGFLSGFLSSRVGMLYDGIGAVSVAGQGGGICYRARGGCAEMRDDVVGEGGNEREGGSEEFPMARGASGAGRTSVRLAALFFLSFPHVLNMTERARGVGSAAGKAGLDYSYGEGGRGPMAGWREGKGGSRCFSKEVG